MAYSKIICVTLAASLSLLGCGSDDDVESISDSGTPDSGTPDSGTPDSGTPDSGTPDDDFVFRTDEPNAYTRVDRLGMPAVSMLFISADGLGDPPLGKNAYNDASPTDDATAGQGGLPKFLVEIILNLSALHTALDDDIAGLALTPCSMFDNDADGLPDCIGQPITPGAPATVSLIIPDFLSINPNVATQFPNGRRLEDPVMDQMLSMFLLDLSTHSLSTLSLNPAANDVPFSAGFPYLSPPHQP